MERFAVFIVLDVIMLFVAGYILFKVKKNKLMCKLLITRVVGIVLTSLMSIPALAGVIYSLGTSTMDTVLITSIIRVLIVLALPTLLGVVFTLVESNSKAHNLSIVFSVFYPVYTYLMFNIKLNADETIEQAWQSYQNWECVIFAMLILEGLLSYIYTEKCTTNKS